MPPGKGFGAQLVSEIVVFIARVASVVRPSHARPDRRQDELRQGRQTRSHLRLCFPVGSSNSTFTSFQSRATDPTEARESKLFKLSSQPAMIKAGASIRRRSSSLGDRQGVQQRLGFWRKFYKLSATSFQTTPAACMN